MTLDNCVLHFYMLFHLSIADSLIKKRKNILISHDSLKNCKNLYPVRKTSLLQSQKLVPSKYKNHGFAKLNSHKKLVSHGNACVACITYFKILLNHIYLFSEWLKKGNVQVILRKRVETVTTRDLSEVCR